MEIKTSEQIEYWLFKDGSRLPKGKLTKKQDKKWVAVEDLEVSRMYDENKKPVWGINLNDSKELTEALSEKTGDAPKK